MIQDATIALSTPAPEISPAQCAQVSRRFGFVGQPQRLSGERDLNFLCLHASGERSVLKFINAAEPDVETQLQIAVLRHLQAHEPGGPISQLSPCHMPSRDGLDIVQCVDVHGAPARARAYHYLEGNSAASTPSSPLLRFQLGRSLALLDQALASFQHPGVQRTFLWNLMQLQQLLPHVRHVDDTALRAFILEYIDTFVRSILPAVSMLRPQVIHNDLSKSNYVVDPRHTGHLAGILDFGDMTCAPMVFDLAIAASYQMDDTPDPFEALDEVTCGFESAQALLAQEREHLLDLVVARLVQRLTITAWRAAQFPENSTYILRHAPQAQRLLHRLMPVWRLRSHHSLRESPSLSSLS